MGAISLRDVRKTYGSGARAVPVIHGVSAEIADGEFIVIVGPSGCGKSTLLRMVAGLEEITAGEIAIGARVVNQLEPAERDIAMVFQNYALYPHMSVFDNMAYGLKIACVPRAEIETRVRKAAKILELEALLERRPRQLSGGQRQRVAMGRAIVRQPQAFLFDEPLSNLDAKLRVQTRLEIQKLHAELGVTSLFVTHDQVEAMTLAQRMIVMNAGQVEQIGTPEEVYVRPASRFVASFIGSPPMNLIDGEVSRDGFQPAGMNLGLSLPPGHRLPAGPLTLGVRPEHLVLAATGTSTSTSTSTNTSTGSGGWPLAVETVELLGAERLVHGRLGGAGGPLFTLRLEATLPAPRAGQTALLACLPEHLHGFDRQDGRRLAAV